MLFEVQLILFDLVFQGLDDCVKFFELFCFFGEELLLTGLFLSLEGELVDAFEEVGIGFGELWSWGLLVADLEL